MIIFWYSEGIVTKYFELNTEVLMHTYLLRKEQEFVRN